MVGNDVRTLAREVVFQFLHGALIAGNDRGGENHRVRGREPDEFMGFVADARERGEFVTLSACGEDDYLLRRIGSEVLHSDNGVVLVFDEPDLARYLDVGAHASPVYDDFLAVLLGKAHDAYQALKVRSEHRDDEPALCVFDDGFERVIHDRLGDGEAGLPHVRRVHEERQNVALLEDRILLVFLLGRLAVLVVELNVASKDNITPLRFDDDAHGIRHRVCYGKEADRGVAELFRLVGLDLANVELRQGGEFLLTLFYS